MSCDCSDSGMWVHNSRHGRDNIGHLSRLYVVSFTQKLLPLQKEHAHISLSCQKLHLKLIIIKQVHPAVNISKYNYWFIVLGMTWVLVTLYMWLYINCAYTNHKYLSSGPCKSKTFTTNKFPTIHKYNKHQCDTSQMCKGHFLYVSQTKTS